MFPSLTLQLCILKRYHLGVASVAIEILERGGYIKEGRSWYINPRSTTLWTDGQTDEK